MDLHSAADSDSSGGPATLAGVETRLPWWRRITVRFEVLVATVVVLAMLLLTALMAYQFSTSARQAIETASGESALRISQLISERVHRIVDPADATLRLLAFDPVASASTLAPRLRRMPVLARLLEQNPLLSAVYVGYPDGQFFAGAAAAQCQLAHAHGSARQCRVSVAVHRPRAGRRTPGGPLELL